MGKLPTNLKETDRMIKVRIMSSEGVLKIREGFRECKKQERQMKRLMAFNRYRKTLGEENDISDRVITTEEIVTIASNIKQKGKISDKDLALLKYGLTQSNDNIVAFLKVSGALHSLVREMTDISSGLISSAIDCCCNLSLGEPKACMQVAKAASPYLISHLHGLNYSLMNTCLWTLGNLVASDIKIWRIIRSQGFLPGLLRTLECPELLENSSYALLHYVCTGLHELEKSELEDILKAILKMKILLDDIYWTLHLLTYLKELHSLLLRSGIVRQCLQLIHQLPINAQSIKTVTPALRIIGNLITEETGQVGVELLHEWNTTAVIAEKVLASGYQHLRNEFCWLVGNIVNHPSIIVQDIIKHRMNEFVLLENIFF